MSCDDTPPFPPSTKQPADPINPPHYTDGEVECIDAIRRLLGDDGFEAYCKGSATKYIWRAGMKQGEPHERCMAKADWYMSWLSGRDPRKEK